MDDDPRQRFATHVRELRERRFPSAAAFCRRTGFRKSYLHFLERGRFLPSFGNLERLENALVQTPDELTELRCVWTEARDWEPPKTPYPGADN